MAKDTRFNDDTFRHHSFEKNNLVGLPLGVKKIHIPDANQQEATDRDDLMWLSGNFGATGPFSSPTSVNTNTSGLTGFQAPWNGLQCMTGLTGPSGPSGATGPGATGIQGVCPAGPFGPFAPIVTGAPPNSSCEVIGGVCSCPEQPPAPWPVGNPVQVVIGTYDEIRSQYADVSGNDCSCVGSTSANVQVSESDTTVKNTIEIQNDKKIWTTKITATLCAVLYENTVQYVLWDTEAPFNEVTPSPAEQAAWDAEFDLVVIHENRHVADFIAVASEMTGQFVVAMGTAYEGEYTQVDDPSSPFFDPSDPFLSGADLANGRAQRELGLAISGLLVDVRLEIDARSDAFHATPEGGPSAGLPEIA